MYKRGEKLTPVMKIKAVHVPCLCRICSITCIRSLNLLEMDLEGTGIIGKKISNRMLKIIQYIKSDDSTRNRSELEVNLYHVSFSKNFSLRFEFWKMGFIVSVKCNFNLQ